MNEKLTHHVNEVFVNLVSIKKQAEIAGVPADVMPEAVKADPRYAQDTTGRFRGPPKEATYSLAQLRELPALQKIKDAEMNQRQAAEILGVSEMTVGRWMRRAFPEVPAPRKSRKKILDHQGLSPIHANSLVPLIDRVSAGRGREAVDPFLSGGNTEAERYYTPVPHGKHTFALEVDGPSMQNPDGKPSFDEGDIIFVDPDKSINSGDLVVARLGLDQEVTFKQYKESDGQKYLWALNPTWTPRKMTVDEDTAIVGVVRPGKFVR